jgi:hypothetical protein
MYFIYGGKYAKIGLDSPEDDSFLIGGGYEAPSIDIASGGVLASGITPVIATYEKDAPANRKVFAWAASGGNLTLRSVNDSGGADIGLNILNNGSEITSFEFKKPVKMESGALDFTAMPTFADNAAAAAGGLGVGRVYKTTTGELRIVV